MSTALDIANATLKKKMKEIIEQDNKIKELKTKISKLKDKINKLEEKNESLEKIILNVKFLNTELREKNKKHRVEKITLQKKHEENLQSVREHAKKLNIRSFKDIKF